MNLKSELHNLRKGNDTVDVYIQIIKVVRDKLPAVGVIVDDELTIQMIDWLYIYIYIYERYVTSITFLQQITYG